MSGLQDEVRKLGHWNGDLELHELSWKDGRQLGRGTYNIGRNVITVDWGEVKTAPTECHDRDSHLRKSQHR